MFLNVALLQISAKEMDIISNVKKGQEYCKKAALIGADICLFPEGWNIGYDLAHINELINNNQLTQDVINKLSKDTDEFIETYKLLAKQLNMAIGITYINYENDVFRNNLSIIDRNGIIQLNYSKVHTCKFGYERIVKPGEEFYVCELDTRIGKVKVGAMICFDREFPESSRILMLKGAEVVLIPNFCKMDRHRLDQLKTRAFENMFGVAMCNVPGEKHGHSAAYDGIAFMDTEEERNMLIVEAGETEGIYMSSFDINALRKYRKSEVWGNAFRRYDCYKKLIDSTVEEPFKRKIKSL